MQVLWWNITIVRVKVFVKVSIFNFAIPLSNMSIIFEKITLDSGWMKFFRDKSLFRMTFDESLILLFGPTRKILFVVERFK